MLCQLFAFPINLLFKENKYTKVFENKKGHRCLYCVTRVTDHGRPVFLFISVNFQIAGHLKGVGGEDGFHDIINK